MPGRAPFQEIRIFKPQDRPISRSKRCKRCKPVLCAEQVYLSAQGLDPSSWGSDRGGLGPGLPIWVQSGQRTRFSGPSCKDVRNPTRHCRTSFSRPASLICCARAESAVLGACRGGQGPYVTRAQGRGEKKRARDTTRSAVHIHRSLVERGKLVPRSALGVVLGGLYRLITQTLCWGSRP